MKYLYSLLAVMLFVSIHSASGQSYVFRVLASKGNISYKSGSAWAPVKTGITFKSGDELKVTEDAYLGLVHSSGRTWELKAPGTYNVNDLAAKLNASNSSVASKYADFVMSKMSESDDVDIMKQAKKYQNVTGAVERAAATSHVNVLIPESVEVLNDEPIIKWEEAAENGTYIVSFTNYFEDELLVQEVKEPFVKLNLNDQKLADEPLIVVKVKLKENDKITSSTHKIKRLDPENAHIIGKELNELKADLQEESSLNYLIIASFYEQNNLLLDALTNYEKAVKLSPDVDHFKFAYQQFLMRYDLVR